MSNTTDNVPALITASEIATILGIKQSAAYKIIKVYNEKLRQAGKIVVRGKLNRKYFFKQLDITGID